MRDDDRSNEPPVRVPQPTHPPRSPHPPSPTRVRAELKETRRLVAARSNGSPGLPAPRRAQGRSAAIVFAAAFVAAALLYWPAFEATPNLPDALYGTPIGLAALTALVDAMVGRRPFGRALWVGTAVLPAVVFARVVYDGLRDSTSHNLWPFEIAIAIGVGLPAALAGAALGWLTLRILHGRPDAG